MFACRPSILATLATFGLLSACAKPPANEEVTSVTPTSGPASAAPPILKPQGEGPSTGNGGVHQLINGIKMRVMALPLKPGDKVFDTSVQQWATITGEVLVKTDDSAWVQAYCQMPCKIKGLAQGLFMLDARDTEDFSGFYQQLRQHPMVTSLELQLHYWPSGGREDS